MKKILSVLMLICALSIALPSEVKAQVYTYKTTGYAHKEVNSQGNWNDWSDWLDSNMRVTISYDDDIIVIYSPKKQIFRITKHIRNYTDNSGGKQAEFAAVDQDGDRCHIRMRIETNGNSQLYVEYSNLILCWNVKRTN